MAIIRHLRVDDYGVHIGKYSQRLKVTKKGKTLVQAPLLHLETVTVANNGVSMSAAAIRECTERGIPIHFMSGTGRAYASLYSAGLTGTVATRRAQLEAYKDMRGLRLVLAFEMGKLQNQSNLLKYMGKYRKKANPSLYDEIERCAAEVLDSLIELERIKGYPEYQEGSITVNDLRAELMGHEGRGARHYWDAVKQTLPEKYNFTKRIGRGARDPINSCLNYGYGILYGQIERALVLAGLDPFAGFLHADRPGKPSMTLDFIEEFRPVVVDRSIFALANKKTAIKQDEEGFLSKETRRTLADKVNERLESPTHYEGKKYPLRNIIQMQARHLATYLRLERSDYEPFLMRW